MTGGSSSEGRIAPLGGREGSWGVCACSNTYASSRKPGTERSPAFLLLYPRTSDGRSPQESCSLETFEPSRVGDARPHKLPPPAPSGSSSVWKSVGFGSRGSQVRILSPRPARWARSSMGERSSDTREAVGSTLTGPTNPGRRGREPSCRAVDPESQVQILDALPVIVPVAQRKRAQACEA